MTNTNPARSGGRSGPDAVVWVLGFLLFVMTACGAPGPPGTPPPSGSQKAFAEHVVEVAASGDVDQLVKLATPRHTGIRPDAEAFASFAKGWDTKADTLDIPSAYSFPEAAILELTRASGAKKKVHIGWLYDEGKWTVVLGQPIKSGSSDSARP
ncbi:hypothetical protein [Sinomonas sp. ASV322]|uniref:hypothetical protein n=1 Tax=Sinomonas sp. ASV322 TaxID=3041920 RepID=UPI0027DD8B73|nr:hypothetical protein [Sinomonas sp. ASV322]MDQ4503670.1 hypothetical protein [Sinomonas sp. ASV322]